MQPINVIINQPSAGGDDEATASAKINERYCKEDDFDNEPVPIVAVLERLHQSMPEANYPIYGDSLKRMGLHYAQNVLDFKDNKRFLVEKVGIPDLFGRLRVDFMHVNTVVLTLWLMLRTFLLRIRYFFHIM